ncbi:hypothetical protein EDB19DRAFT_1741588 [Suillus lakei]|nr:hypothetical protein EDB19DRAFT_1741588 [Suillus lakei]
MRHCGLVGTQVIMLPTASAMGNKLPRTSGVGRNGQDIGQTVVNHNKKTNLATLLLSGPYAEKHWVHAPHTLSVRDLGVGG